MSELVNIGMARSTTECDVPRGNFIESKYQKVCVTVSTKHGEPVKRPVSNLAKKICVENFDIF